MKRLAPILAAGLMTATLFAQPEDRQYTIKIASETVALDVIVHDAQGNFVVGLKPEDFEVRENGKLRPVHNLVFVDKTRPEHEKSALPPSEQKLYQDRLLVVLDRVTASVGDYHRALTALRRFLQGLPPRTEVAIYLFDGDLQAIHPFSRDRNALLDSLERASRRLPSRPLAPPSEVYEEIASLFTERLAIGFRITDTTSQQDLFRRTVSEAVRVVNRHLSLVEIQTKSYLGGLRSLVSTLGHLPGNKNLLLVSRGVKLHHGDEYRQLVRDNIRGRMGGGFLERNLLSQTGQVDILDFHQDLAQLIGDCNQRQIRMYAIDPAGLQALAPGGSADSSSSFYQLLNLPDRKFFRELSSLSEPVDSLAALAQGTNGLAFYNRNRLEDAFDGILEHNSRYYLLGYEPLPDRQEDKLYEVKVRLKRPGKHRVLAEKGYLHRGRRRSSEKLKQALAFPELFRQIPVRAKLLLFQRPTGPVVSAILEISGDEIPFASYEGRLRSDLEVYGFFLDSGGLEVDRFTAAVPLLLSREEYDLYRDRSFITHHEADLAPGRYQLRLMVRDRATGEVGATVQEVAVPELNGELSLSDLVLSQDIRETALTRRSPLFAGPYRVVPEGDLQVRASDPVFVYFQVYNLRMEGTKPNATARFRLSRENSEACWQSRPIVISPVASSEEIAVSHLLPVRELGLGEGRYTLDVEVTDHVSGQEVRGRTEIELVMPRRAASGR